MTSKAKARAGNVVQATFLFEKEPIEQVPVVAKLDPPKARIARTKLSDTIDAGAITSMIESLKPRAPKKVADAAPVETPVADPPKERPARASRTRDVLIAPPQAAVVMVDAPKERTSRTNVSDDVPPPAVAASQPPKARAPRTKQIEEVATVQSEPVQAVVAEPEQPATKRPVSKRTKTVETAPIVVEAAPPRATPVEASVPDVVPAKQPRKRQPAKAIVVEATRSVETVAEEHIEPEVAQTKPPRKRRVAETAVAIADVPVVAAPVSELVPEPQPAHVKQPRKRSPKHVEAVAPVENTVQEVDVREAHEPGPVTDAVEVQVTKAKQRRPSRARATAKAEDVAEVAPTIGAEPVVTVSTPEVVAEAVPEPRRRKRAAAAPPTDEEQAAPTEKRTRKPRTPVAAEEPKNGGDLLLPVRNGQREIPPGPMFLMSYDDSPKRTLAEKVETAMLAYQARFARRPNLVLVNTNVGHEFEVADVAIERRSTVPPNNFWAGMQPVVRPAILE